MSVEHVMRRSHWVLFLVAFSSVLPLPALAVPSFSRQTSLDCAACHTVFPQLTDFGRNFKLHAYTMIADTKGQTDRLKEGAQPPICAMTQTSYSSTAKAVPGSQNGTVLFPDQLSLFYAGRIADDLGAFTQVTYDGIDDHFTMDNADIRFARQGNGSLADLVYGVTLNNNPGVSDLWNSTPVWGFPYASSGTAPVPAAAAQIDGGLGQQVAGLGAYVAWSDRVYAEAALYRSSQIGADAPLTPDAQDVIKGAAPYWRLALTTKHGNQSFELGTYGMATKLYPGGGTALSGSTNHVTDAGFDLQYQWLGDEHTVTVHSTYIHERQQWDAGVAAGNAANAVDILRTFRADGTYYYHRLVGASVGFFTTSGDSDPLLYPTAGIDGSANGDPQSRGFVLELGFMPRYNTRLSIHYTAYSLFNGGSTNYDGFGRDAGDNNTLYVNAWLMY